MRLNLGKYTLVFDEVDGDITQVLRNGELSCAWAEEIVLTFKARKYFPHNFEFVNVDIRSSEGTTK